MDNTHEDFYQHIRAKIKDYLRTKEGKTNKFCEYLLLAPDLFYLLCKLTFDKNVSVTDKAKLAAAIAYFVSPVDLLPEAFIGPVGYLDDVAIAAYVLNSIINNTDPLVVKSHWTGEGDILDQVQTILQIADEMLGSGLWRKIRKIIDSNANDQLQK